MQDEMGFGGGFAVVVVGAGARGHEIEEAIVLAGGRMLRRIAWEAMPAELMRQVAQPVLVADARGVGEDLLAAMLPRLETTAAALDLPVIVCLDVAEIDVVAGALLGVQAQLLCGPSVADLIGALVLARGSGSTPMLNAYAREGEGERLRRLNAEVARIAQALAELARREADAPAGGAADVEDRHSAFRAEPARPAPRADPGDAAAVRAIIRRRRMRDALFPGNLFEDPAWDMLLDLYAARLEGRRVSVSSLCIAAAVAPTTALRWIGKLTEAGLFVREPDPADRRRAFMALSDAAAAKMHDYLAAANGSDPV
ncbi:winged helix DNA-binding protein [Sphingomonas sp. GM_Shp_2]|uniref:winged helix DNA-binding protein n=1 Tax=Sphingomonas sp. GM_Shp_2 TaxID=2937380 RepID=UPI00226AC677